MKKRGINNKEFSELGEEDFREIRKTIKRIPAKNTVSNAGKHKKSILILLCCMITMLVVCLGVGIVLFAGGDHEITNSTAETGDVLTGIWSYDDVTVYSFDGFGHGTLELPLNTYEFSYIIKGGNVRIDFTDDSAEDREYDYSVSDGVLMLVDADGISYQFTKVL